MPHRISGQQDPNLSHLKDLEQYKSVMSEGQLALYNRYQNFEYKGFNAEYMYNPGWRDRSNMIISLRQEHFNEGTVRLQHPGIYVLQEDIVFHPNPNNDFMPTHEQIKSGRYPVGRGGAYHLGFFAAITIESDDIILNLNGHSIVQSHDHYLDQRFFAMIELASAPFITSQGPHQFSEESTFKNCNNVYIMNGTLGRSSHYSIHGNGVTNLVLYNLEMKDFQVAGLHLNAVKTALLCDLNIHDSNSASHTPVKVLSEYSQARFIRRCLSKASKEHPKEILEYYKYDVDKVVVKTAVQINQDLLDSIRETQEAIRGGTKNIPEIYKNMSARQLSDTNIYGLLLNVKGVAIGKKISDRPTVDGTNNEDVMLINIIIKNIISEPQETIGIKDKTPQSLDSSSTENSNFKIRGPVSDIFDVQRSTVKPTKQRLGNSAYQRFGSYKANPLSNAQALAGKINMYDKGCVGNPYITNNILRYIKDPIGNLSRLERDNRNISLCFGGDSMAHTMKGNVGLFIQGGKNIRGFNILIEGVHVINESTSPDIGNDAHDGKKAFGYLEVVGENVKMTNMTVNNVMSQYGKEFTIPISVE
jgi:hypothetical protein